MSDKSKQNGKKANADPAVQGLDSREERFAEFVNALDIAQNMRATNKYSQERWNNLLANSLRVIGGKYGGIFGTSSKSDCNMDAVVYAVLQNYSNEAKEEQIRGEDISDYLSKEFLDVAKHVASANNYIVCNSSDIPLSPCSRGVCNSLYSSILAVPIVLGKETEGVFIAADNAHGYRESDVEFIKPLLTAIGLAIKDSNESRRRQSGRELNASESQFWEIFNALPVGVAIADEFGKIELVNSACETALGLSKEDLYSGKYQEKYKIVRSDGTPMPAEETALMRASAERQSIMEVESGLILDSDKIRWLSVNAVPLSDKSLKSAASYIDISRRKAVENELNEQRNFLNAILNGIDIAIFVMDVEDEGKVFRFNFANDACERYNGVANSLLSGKTLDEMRDYFTPEYTVKLGKRLRECRDCGKQIEYEYMSPIGGEDAWWLARLMPLQNNKGEICRIISASTQITERVMTERKLRDINSRLEGLNTELDKRVKERTADLQRSLSVERDVNLLRDTFAVVIAHQFRTPLTVILSSVEILRLYGASLPAEKVEKLYQRVYYAISSIRNLLDTIYKIEEVNEKIRSMRINLINCSYLIQTTVKNFIASTREARSIRADLPDTLIAPADEFMLRCIIIELLSNAARYSAADSEIIISASQSPVTVDISVSDSGIGIDQDEISRIFEPFYRPKETENIFGAGLGLAVSKRYAVAMRGEISCKSKLGIGSTFTVSLPRTLNF